MDLTINMKSKQSFWQQVYDQIIHKIINGELQGGSELPSIRQFSKITGVSECTVKRAYDQLKSDGYIYSVNTKGHYVSDDIDNVNRIRKKHIRVIENYIDNIIQTGAQIGMDEAEILALFKKRRVDVV